MRAYYYGQTRSSCKNSDSKSGLNRTYGGFMKWLWKWLVDILHRNDEEIKRHIALKWREGKYFSEELEKKEKMEGL